VQTFMDSVNASAGKSKVIEEYVSEEEIRFACDNVPEIYGVETPSFEEIWERFGTDIEKNGLGHSSKVILFIAQKVG